MSSGTSRRRLLAGACLAAMPTAWAGQEVPDVLKRPAAQSPRAAQGAMLAITRAGQRLVAVGERGTVLLSDDHGATWRQAPVPVSVSLTAVQFLDAQRGWAVGHGGVVLASTDGGATWLLKLDGIRAARLALDAVPADSPQRAEAQRLVDDGPDKPLLDLHFSDALNGFVVGAYGLALATRDGGQTWQPWIARLPNPKSKHLYRIATAGSRLFIAGEQGLLLRSDDGGESFAEMTSPYAGTWFGLHAESDGALLAFGLRGNAYAAPNAAAPWAKVELATNNSLVDCLKLPEGRLLLVDQQGQTYANAGRADAFQRAAINFKAPVAAMAQAADGGLVAVTLQGMRRVANPSPNRS